MADPVYARIKLYRGKTEVFTGVASAEDGTPLDVRDILRFQARIAFGDADPPVISKEASDFTIGGSGNNVWSFALQPSDTLSLPSDRTTVLHFELQAASSDEDPVPLALGEFTVFPSVFTPTISP